MANKARELDLQILNPNREANAKARPVTDILALGYRKFEKTSLTIFDKKLAGMKQGFAGQSEVDEIPPCPLMRAEDTGELEQDEEISVLHDD